MGILLISGVIVTSLLVVAIVPWPTQQSIGFNVMPVPGSLSATGGSTHAFPKGAALAIQWYFTGNDGNVSLWINSSDSGQQYFASFPHGEFPQGTFRLVAPGGAVLIAAVESGCYAVSGSGQHLPETCAGGINAYASFAQPILS